MNVVRCKSEQTIALENVTYSHLVVSKRQNGGRYILSRHGYNDGNFVFLNLESKFTNGNGWIPVGSKDMHKAIDEALSSGDEVRAYERTNQLQAFKWLYDE